jgi:hypothetical protein
MTSTVESGNERSGGRAGRRPWMRQHSDSAATVDQLDRFGHRDAMLVEIRGPTGTEIPVEGVAEIHRPSVFNECARHMRPPYRGVARNREHIFERDADAESVEETHNPSARSAAPLKDGERRISSDCTTTSTWISSVPS